MYLLKCKAYANMCTEGPWWVVNGSPIPTSTPLIYWNADRSWEKFSKKFHSGYHMHGHRNISRWNGPNNFTACPSHCSAACCNIAGQRSHARSRWSSKTETWLEKRSKVKPFLLLITNFRVEEMEREWWCRKDEVLFNTDSFIIMSVPPSYGVGTC